MCEEEQKTRKHVFRWEHQEECDSPPGSSGQGHIVHSLASVLTDPPRWSTFLHLLRKRIGHHCVWQKMPVWQARYSGSGKTQRPHWPKLHCDLERTSACPFLICKIMALESLMGEVPSGVHLQQYDKEQLYQPAFSLLAPHSCWHFWKSSLGKLHFSEQGCNLACDCRVPRPKVWLTTHHNDETGASRKHRSLLRRESIY